MAAVSPDLREPIETYVQFICTELTNLSCIDVDKYIVYCALKALMQ